MMVHGVRSAASRRTVAAAMLLSLVAPAGSAAATVEVTTAPPNDDRAAATVLTDVSGTPIHDDNEAATKEVGEPDHVGDAGGASVWYAFTPTADGEYEVILQGSTFDTLLAVYTEDDAGELVEVASSDDHSDVDTWSALFYTGTADTTYFIAVDGKGGATGGIVLTLGTVAPPSTGGGTGGAGGHGEPPVAQPDDVTVESGVFTVVDILTNDTDPEGDALGRQDRDGQRRRARGVLLQRREPDGSAHPRVRVHLRRWVPGDDHLHVPGRRVPRLRRDRRSPDRGQHLRPRHRHRHRRRARAHHAHRGRRRALRGRERAW